jgi:cytoskeletal protein CcmA (bactofilin family)
MFDKKTKSYTDLLGKTNRIVEGTTIDGNIVSQADFRLDGILTGNFKSNGKLVIGPAASVTGDIVCKNCDIEGNYHGNIQVAELLTVKAKASIKGAVICAKLSVEPGADFSASCEMKPPVKHPIPQDVNTQQAETNA